MESRNKQYTVIISEKASEMLVSHARFLASVSEEAAQNLINEFTMKAASLEAIHERNPWLSDRYLPVNKYRKMMLCKRYLIIYQVKNDKVYIDYMIDCRQEYRWLL